MCEKNDFSPEELAECKVYGTLLKKAKADGAVLAGVILEGADPDKGDVMCVIAIERAIEIVSTIFDFMLWRAQRARREAKHDESDNSVP